MKTIICVFVALCLINSIASGAMVSPLTCEQLNIPAMQNFKKDRQMGLWYLYEVMVIPGYENIDCWTTTFNSTGNRLQEKDFYRDLKDNTESLFSDNSYRIVSLEYTLDKVTNRKFIAFYGDRNTSQTLLTTYPKPGIGRYIFDNDPNTYTVLQSDYINYSVEILCGDRGDHSERYPYVFTRRRTVTPAIQSKIDKVLAANAIDKTPLKKIIQDKKMCAPAPPAQQPPSSNGLGGLLQKLLSLLL